MLTLKEKYINIFTDFGFKKLFGSEFNKHLLLDFLNELIGRETGVIKELSFLSTEQLGRSRADRKAIYDIYCENEKGEKFIVELQKAKQNYFKDRSIYYSTFPIQQQAERGDWDFRLNAIYTIGILDFVFDEGKDDKNVFHHEVKMIDTKTGKVFYDKLTYIYLEMPKFTKTEDELETHFDKWLYILKNLHKLTNRPLKLQELVFNQLFDAAEIAQMDDKEVMEYEESLKVYRDLKNSLDTAYDEGKIEGKIETAARLKELGVSMGMIAEATGLSIDEIEKL
ncbi:Rpn family recombination-promoting nuclease/putative transposase [Chrysiogenes arsenatis]|uniref:Rpn family recombination-promoting nuclease/putative transposase n=1 Tax=Chrysiogenes arsenatis TaxID=309797 RepID=UPI000402F0CD|nr:Rpn family recombination-promoting nuclease/putative transposase [Chrysiogenes arsenatis]